MKTLFLFTCSCLLVLAVPAQQTTYDLVTYSPLPGSGWKKESGQNFITYSRMDGGSWCQITIYKNAVSKGSIEEDSQVQWETLILSQHTLTGGEEKTVPATSDGWQVMSRSGIWQHNGANVLSILTTYSNRSNCVNILCNATAQPYLATFQQWIGGIRLGKGNTVPQNNSTNPVVSNATNNTMQGKVGSTRFDDGWTSVAKEDWVEVSKPGIKILVHYPNSQTDQYNADKLQGDQAAWNILVAPRYTRVSGLQQRGMQSYPSITFLTADASEKESGKKVHVVLYKKNYDQGNGRYLEVVADSRAVFEKEFGNNYINTSSWETLEQSKSWDKLAAMQWRNKFYVNAASITGKWTSTDFASLSYYYVNSGNYAGSTATAIADEFTFTASNTYNSQHSGASGQVGAMQFATQKYKGRYTLTAWTLTLTNRFKGEAEVFNCQLEAVKGGWLLLLTDKNNSTKSLVKAR